jgi:hypothetical protein
VWFVVLSRCRGIFDVSCNGFLRVWLVYTVFSYSLFLMAFFLFVFLSLFFAFAVDLGWDVCSSTSYNYKRVFSMLRVPRVTCVPFQLTSPVGTVLSDMYLKVWWALVWRSLLRTRGLLGSHIAK